MAVVLDKIPNWRIKGVDVSGIGKETIKEVSNDDVPTHAAAMTYHVVLAIFPFLLLLTGITALIDTVFDVPDLTERIVDQASSTLPEDATSVIEGFTDEVVNAQGGAAIGLGLLGALWAASSAMKAAMKSVNNAYNVKEERSFIKKQLVGVGLTLLFGGLVLGAAVLLFSGRPLAGGLGDVLGWEQQFVTLWNIATPILAVLMLIFAVSLFYWLAPNAESQYRFISPGTLLFVVGWIVFSFAFAYYISNFGNYNRIYGSLAGVIIFLIWLYWSNMLLLVGAELNAVVARRYDEEYQSDPKTETRNPEAA